LKEIEIEENRINSRVESKANDQYKESNNKDLLKDTSLVDDQSIAKQNKSNYNSLSIMLEANV
jgi:hypothetical protein